MMKKWLNPLSKSEQKDDEILTDYLKRMDFEKKLVNKVNIGIELITIITAGITLGSINANDGIRYLEEVKRKL